MKDIKTRGMKNIFFGFGAQFATIAVGIVIPRLVLVNLGSEANGLLNSISSILTYMSLLEAGVGTASVQALYKPVGEEDHNSINRIMSATNYFYKRTGYIYLATVIVLAIGFTWVIDTSIPKYQVFLVVILAGLSGVMSYFFQGKFKLLLTAEGKNYITTNITTITTVGVSILKAIVLVAGANVVVVQSVYFLFNLVQMLFFMFYIKNNYSWLNLHVTPDFDAISQKNAVLVHQISSLIFSNTDVIILTIFTSLKEVSVYSMYAMIFGMIKSVAVTVSDSFVYALGQSFKDKNRFMRMFNAYEVYTLAFTFSLFCIGNILILPFLKLYTAGVSDVNYIDPYISWLFVIFYLLHNGRASSSNVINIAQEFEGTKWRSVLESVINLSVSIVLTIKFGIYGVLLGTIAALLYRTNDMIIYAARILKRSSLVTYKRWMSNFVLFMIVSIVTSYIDIDLSSYFNMCIYGVVLCCTIIPIFILVNSMLEPKTAKYTYNILKNMFVSKFMK